MKSVRESLGNMSDTELTDEDRSQLREIDKLQSTLDALLDSSRPPTPETRVLRQLYFPSIFSREDSVPGPSDGTFEWILRGDQEPDDDDRLLHERLEDDSQWKGPKYDETWFAKQIQQSRCNQLHARSTLLDWLSTGNGIFHISGKAGSGKSTIMKLVAGHAKTQEELKRWAGQNTLIFASFFAWRSNRDAKQKSLHGLYQSILFSTLIRCTNLISLVFPDATKAFSTTRYEPFIDEPYFRLPELHKGLQKLIAGSATNRVCLCFLIDGLDEFENDVAGRHSYADLAEELALWAQHDNVKLLVSSRPEPEFASIVPERLQIHLHDLTKPDIMKAGRILFEKHQAFEQMRSYYLGLVDKIVVESRGVFLWAFFMIVELRNLAADGEDAQSLRKRLDESPSLDRLYHQLLASINPVHRDMVYKMLFLVMRLDGDCSNFVMTWVEQLFEPEFPTTSTIKTYTEAECDKRRQLAKRRVARTKGLLEITDLPDSPRRHSPSSTITRVNFFHRTAYEFFEESQQMRDLSTRFPDMRSVSLKVKVHLAQLWFLDKSKYLPTEDSPMILGNILNSSKEWKDFTEERHRWLDGLRKVARYHNTKGPPIFCGWSIRPSLFRSGQLQKIGYSHLHYVISWIGDLEYVRRELDDMPGTMHADGELSLLLSASTAWYATPLVEYLLERGVSPNEQVEFHGTNHTASVWFIFCTLFASLTVPRLGGWAEETDRLESYCLVMERFLETGAVDLNVLVILGERGLQDNFSESDGTHAISLKDLLQQFDPDKHETWAELIGECEKRRDSSEGRVWSFAAAGAMIGRLGQTISYLLTERIWGSMWDGIASLLTRGLWTSVHDAWICSTIWKSEPVKSSHSEAYIPFRIGMKPSSSPRPTDSAPEDYGFYVHSVVLGELRILASDICVRIY